MSRGMIAKNYLEKFINNLGEEYFFEKTLLFPNKKENYDSYEELRENLNLFKEENKDVEIKEVNAFKKIHKSAILVILFSKENKKIGFLRYFISLPNKGYNCWRTCDFGKDTGYYCQDDKSSIEETMPIKPNDLLGSSLETNFSLLDLEELVTLNLNQLYSCKKIDSVLFDNLSCLFFAAFNKKESPWLCGGAKNYLAYAKYIGEFLAPVSLVNDWLILNKEEHEKNKKILPNNETDFSSAKISYATSKVDPLFDSCLNFENNKQIRISSKSASKSSASSIKSLAESTSFLSVENQQTASAGLLQILNENGVIKGLLDASVFCQLITQEEKEQLGSMFKPKLIGLGEFRKSIVLSSNLENIAKTVQGYSPYEATESTMLPQYNPCFHVLAGLAKQLVKRINKTEEFSVVAKEILSKMRLLQTRCFIETRKDDCKLSGFEVKFPPVFNGKVFLVADKNYTTTRINGKIGFIIK